MPDQPFTVPHFRRWASQLVLDSGENWKLEPFQAKFLKDLFAGFLESWLVIPEGNAKTTLAGAIALYEAQHREFASVTIAAAARDQAMWLYESAAGFVTRSPAIEKRFKCQEGYRRIRCDQMGSRIQVFAADDRTGDGARPTLALLEELHRHRDLRLYRTWRGKIEKRGGQIVAISTAGDPDGEFEEVRARMTRNGVRKGAFVRAVTKHTVLHDYSVVGDPDNIDDVKQANPLKAITKAQLKRKHDSPSMTPGHWLRFSCGIPAGLNDQPIQAEDWDKLKVDIGQIEDGESVILVPSVGHVGAVAIAAVRPDDRVAVRAEVVQEQDKVTYTAVERKIRELCDRYDVETIYHPLVGFTRSAELLQSEGYPMQEQPQSPVGLSAASGTFNRLLRGGLIMHDGDPILRAHALSATTKVTESGERYEIADRSRALIAVIMAVHAITAVRRKPTIHVWQGAGNA